MEILKVNGLDKDFVLLCKKLEDFQYNLIPGLKEKGYTLTDDLDNVTGFIMYIDKKPIGSMGIKRVSDEVCNIVRVFVEEEYRGNGYSKQLFEKIENLIKELNYKKAEIVAWCDAKPALRLYEKMGFNSSEEKVSEWYGGYKYVELYKNY
ncbi:MAG: GNAT family N-acetyltransferase [Clostridia bacterium]|nr:GNAT family N-acetyltransferase [Clostridia bacterium]